MSEHENEEMEVKRLKASVLRRHNWNVVHVCNGAMKAIRLQLQSKFEYCELTEDRSEMYLVFRFIRRRPDETTKSATFTVLKDMIQDGIRQDGIMSEQRLKAALWDTLGRLRGMV